jgi:protein TonB
MLAYAANRSRVGASQSSPNTLLFVASGHIALLAVAMSVKMALPPKPLDPPPLINVPIHKPPPPTPSKTPATHHGAIEPLDVPPLPIIPLAETPAPLDRSPAAVPGSMTTVDPGPVPLPPLPVPDRAPVGVSSDAQLLTPSSELRPPYPQAKLFAGEEASLKLRLTIDERGRVVAVEPVGRADPVFLSAARRHLLSHWRYKPAMKDGNAVATSLVISLLFQLDA